MYSIGKEGVFVITEKDKDDFMDWCRNSGKMVEELKIF